MLGVSADTPAANKKFREKFDFPYDLLSDEDMSMSVAYGVADADAARPSRKSVLIGPDGKVAKVFPKVRVKGHVDAVIAAIDEAGLGK